MLLCLDVGNTHILGGVFDENKKLIARFRYATDLIGTADQFGIFLLNILEANKIPLKEISAIAMCSVVPSCDFTLRHALSSYFSVPLFVLQSGAKTGLMITYKNPNEVGADRIADAMGGIHQFPEQNLIIIDMGTATTFSAITKKKQYLGGSILPGMRLWMESLKEHTAKLMAVDIEMPATYIGRSTRESIQAGLYYGHLGALKEMIAGYKKEVFSTEPVLVIGSGGFSQLYKDQSVFDVILPDLVLQGLCYAYELNADRL